MFRDYSPKISEGHDMEEGVLGKVKAEYNRTFEGETYEKHTDYPFEVLYPLLKKQEFQPNTGEYDPNWPEKQFPRSLLTEVATNLGLDDNSQLAYYTAVNSHLDWKGVDAFLELHVGNGEVIRCPLDISCNLEKIAPGAVEDRGQKIVFHWPEEGISKDEERVKWKNKLDKLTGVAVEHLRRKASNGGHTIRQLTEYELTEAKKILEQQEKMLLVVMPENK